MSLTIFQSLQILITSPDPNHLWWPSNTSFFVRSFHESSHNILFFSNFKIPRAWPRIKRKIKALYSPVYWYFACNKWKCYNFCSFLALFLVSMSSSCIIFKKSKSQSQLFQDHSMNGLTFEFIYLWPGCTCVPTSQWNWGPFFFDKTIHVKHQIIHEDF